MKYIVSRTSVIPLEGPSKADYLLSDKDIKLLQTDQDSRNRILDAVGKDIIILERLGSSPKGSEGVYIKFTDEFEKSVLKGDKL